MIVIAGVLITTYMILRHKRRGEEGEWAMSGAHKEKENLTVRIAVV